MNRAIQNQYPPGSTFKPVTALAALEDGIVTENTPAFCSGGTFFSRLFRCWKQGGHGSVSLHRALVESCDVYFYEIGKRINIDTIAQYASALGLGRPTGVELESEASGIVPSTKWKLKMRKEKWYQGETLSVAIGQGYLAVTPIQMARMIATIVNGGKLYKLHLVKNGDNDMKPESVAELNTEYVEMVKKALIGVVYESGGTGGAARSNIVSIGGKTGTAQVIGGAVKEKDLPDKYKDHAWFIAFAPQNNPEIAVSVFVEHGGHGGSTSAPIAKKVIEAYFNPPKPDVGEEKQDNVNQVEQNPGEQKLEHQVPDEQKPKNEDQSEQYTD
jgi:penicillin-binding protein 2